MSFVSFFHGFLECFLHDVLMFFKIFQTSLENVDFVEICVFLKENTYFYDFEVAEINDFSLFLQPFLGIDFGTDFPLFLDAFLAHYSSFLALFSILFRH